MVDNSKAQASQAQIVTVSTHRPFMDVIARIEGILGAPRSQISWLLSGVKTAEEVRVRVKKNIQNNDFM